MFNRSAGNDDPNLMARGSHTLDDLAWELHPSIVESPWADLYPRSLDETVMHDICHEPWSFDIMHLRHCNGSAKRQDACHPVRGLATWLLNDDRPLESLGTRKGPEMVR